MGLTGINMKKLTTSISVILLLSACTVSDQELRTRYARYYQQDDAYVEQFAKKIKPFSVENLAIQAAKIDNERMPKRIGLNLYGKGVRAEKNVVIFEYEFDKNWWNNQSQSSRQENQKNMQKDLIYRTCSLRTVALSQEKGLEESHRYYIDYATKQLAFELKTSRQICQANGFIH